jgi:hypothetical protein
METKPFPAIKQSVGEFNPNFLDQEALQQVIDNVDDYMDGNTPPTREQVTTVICVLIDLGYMDLGQ